MKSTLQKIKSVANALHKDDRGASMVEYILLVAAISIPLLFVIIWFWKELAKWLAEVWNSISDSGPGSSPDGTDPNDF